MARDPFVPGEPITKAKIVSPGSRGFLAAVLAPGMRAVSVPVTATSGISGFVFPGDQVDILITHPLPASANGNDTAHKASETVLHDVRVIAVGQKLDTKGNEPLVAQTATFEVTPKQSEMIAVATEMGKLSLSLRSLAAASNEKSPGDLGSGDERGTFTLDSEVSQLLTTKGNSGAGGGTGLRGNSKSG